MERLYKIYLLAGLVAFVGCAVWIAFIFGQLIPANPSKEPELLALCINGCSFWLVVTGVLFGGMSHFAHSVMTLDTMQLQAIAIQINAYATLAQQVPDRVMSDDFRQKLLELNIEYEAVKKRIDRRRQRLVG